MIKEQWKKIGVQADVKEVERSLFFTRVRANEHQIAIWANDGTELLYLFPRHGIPVDPAESLMGTPIAVWYASGGKQGKAPDDTPLLKALDMFRSANGKKAARADQDRPGDLQDHDRRAVLHRDGRPVAGDDGGSHREPQDGEHGVTADQRAALPDAGDLSALDVLLQGVGNTALIPAAPGRPCAAAREAGRGRRRGETRPPCSRISSSG